MALPTWKEWLLAQTCKEGTWLNSVSKKTIATVSGWAGENPNEARLRVGAAKGEAALLVAEADGLVQFLHNVDLVEIGAEFAVVGATGLKSVLKFYVVPESTWASSPKPKSATRKQQQALPTKSSLLTVDSPSEFKALKGAPASGVSFDNLADTKAVFWVHPSLFGWMPQGETNAEQLATDIIRGLGSTKSTVDGMEITEPSESLLECYKLVEWLWLVSNDLFDKPGTLDTPDDNEMEEFILRTTNKLQLASDKGPAKGQPTRAEGRAFTEETEATFRTAMTTMADLQQKMLSRQDADASRKKLTHKLTDEAGELFRVLAAKNWLDLEPTMTPMTTKLLNDKDATKGIAFVQQQASLRRWKCTVSSPCLVQFFGQGFQSPEFEALPSGICLFMFKPKTAAKGLSNKEREALLRARFGKDDMDEEGIKMFAKSDLYLPRSFDELTKQVATMVQFLDMLTGTNSLASEGYRALQRKLEDLEMPLISHENSSGSKLLWAKIAFFGDGIFQAFVRKMLVVLSELQEGESAIEKARQTESISMQQEVELAFVQAHLGLVPNFPIPEALRTHRRPDSQVGGTVPKKQKTEPTTERKHNQPDWWSVNPELVESWKLPPGKDFDQVYDYRDPAKKEWAESWPKIQHHEKGYLRFSCPRYFVVGRCRASCGMAHQLVSKLPKAAYEEMEKKATAAKKSL